MKNEKLELLLNKVVEFYKPDACQFKGFLYKDGQGYYIKVVETISGTDIAVNDILYLKEGEDEFVIHADKPKLMRVSLKSWHYRLMKYILGDKTPTPQTMQNGCPYYWLVVFSLIVCPFVALWDALKFIFLLIPEFFIFLLEKSVDSWLASLDDVTAYEMESNRYTTGGKDAQRLPVTAKLFFSAKDEDFFTYFLTKKYGNLDYKERQEKNAEIHVQWDAWRKEVREAREKRNAEQAIRDNERRQKEYERALKQEANRLVWEARMKPFNDGMSKLVEGIKELFTFKGDVKSIIKKTKQIVGAVVTLLLLGVAFFVVIGLAYVLMVVIDACIAYWWVLLIILGILAVAGLIYVIGVFIGGWLQNVVNKYKSGKRIWYIEPLIYLIWYPVKYIGLAVAYSVFYVLYIPIKFVFYTVIWKLFLVNLGLFIWKGICAFGRGLANSTGVFGEYFSASYTDYCPGIEWVDVPEEESNN